MLAALGILLDIALAKPRVRQPLIDREQRPDRKQGGQADTAKEDDDHCSTNTAAWAGVAMMTRNAGAARNCMGPPSAPYPPQKRGGRIVSELGSPDWSGCLTQMGGKTHNSAAALRVAMSP